MHVMQYLYQYYYATQIHTFDHMCDTWARPGTNNVWVCLMQSTPFPFSSPLFQHFLILCFALIILYASSFQVSVWNPMFVFVYFHHFRFFWFSFTFQILLGLLQRKSASSHAVQPNQSLLNKRCSAYANPSSKFLLNVFVHRISI